MATLPNEEVSARLLGIDMANSPSMTVVLFMQPIERNYYTYLDAATCDALLFRLNSMVEKAGHSIEVVRAKCMRGDPPLVIGFRDSTGRYRDFLWVSIAADFIQVEFNEAQGNCYGAFTDEVSLTMNKMSSRFMPFLVLCCNEIFRHFKIDLAIYHDAETLEWWAYYDGDTRCKFVSGMTLKRY